jgi:hypothetical protein
MTWTLTLEVMGAALALGVVSYLYTQHLARSFDQRYNRSDRGHTPAE